MKFRRFLLFLVGFSMPFNNVALIPNFSVGLFSSAIYFTSLIPYILNIKKIGKNYGKFVWSIFLFILLFTFINLINKCEYNTPVFPVSIFLCFILMLLMLIHSLYDRKVLSFCLHGLAFGGVLMSIFFFLGIGISIGDDQRLVMFGENSNALGIYMGLSAIIILYDFVLNSNFGKYRFLLLLFFVPIVNLMFATGSRTAFLIFLFSIIVILFFHSPNSLLGKIALIAIGIVCCIYTFNKLKKTDSVIIQRLIETVEEGNTSGRDRIVESLIPYIIESPIWGYGQTGYVNVSKNALAKVSIIGNVIYGYSPHNVIIEILLYTGIFGLLLWLNFWWNIGKESWILYKSKKLLLPGLMCIPILACIISGQLLAAKWSFIIYAYIISEYYYFRNSQ